MAIPVDAKTYFVSVNGSDTAPGGIDQPFLTITKAYSIAVAGDTIFVRGGIYTVTSTISLSKSGTSSSRYYLFAYLDERPLLDCSSMAINSNNRGIKLSGNYWCIKGIDVKKAGDNGMYISGSNNIIEFCEFYENSDTGLQLGGGASNNQIINCDSYFNSDPSQGNADGFAPKLDVGSGNYFYGCRSWQNSDDGWDGYVRPRPVQSNTTTLEKCWSFDNGYLKNGSASSGNGNGFKMGGSDSANLEHNFILKKCLAFGNRVKGFDQNNNRGSMTLYNCTGYQNAANYSISGPIDSGCTVTVTNCVALGNYGSLGSYAIQQTNSWLSPFGVTSADFLSVDTTGIRGPRKPDGSLPDAPFLHLAAGSHLIDAGTNVGIPFLGNGPDLGAFEFDPLAGTLPTLVFSHTSRSFGNVLIWTTRLDSITVTNTGLGLLFISSVTSDNALFTVAPNTNINIESNASRKIYITFHPLTTGAETGRIIFNNNDIANPNDTVTVIGVGSSGGFLLSTTFLDFGNVRKGQSATDSVVVTNSSLVKLNITLATTAKTEFVVSPTSIQIDTNCSQGFAITYTATGLGLDISSVVFSHDGPSSSDTLVVQGKSVQPSFRIATSTIDQGGVPVGTTTTKSFLIYNDGTDTLHIAGLKWKRSEFQISLFDTSQKSISPKDSMKVFVKYTAAIVGILKDTLVFEHDAPSVMDTAYIVAAGVQAAFSMTRTAITFGISTQVGFSTADSVTVVNNGTSVLVIASAVSTDPDFAINPTSCTVDTGEFQRFIITFTPSAAGQQTGKILFNHNAAFRDTLFVSGTGIGKQSIAIVRSAPNGTEVLFKALVTRVCGDYTFLQDTTGGITMYQSVGAWHDSVALRGIQAGDSILVQGKTSESNSLKVISDIDLIAFKVLSHDHSLPMPKVVTLKQISVAGESCEAQLVKVINITVASADSLYKPATTYSIVDASDSSNAVSLRIPDVGDSNADGTVVKRVVTFSGIVGQFSSSVSGGTDGYQLLAIDSTDLVDNSLGVSRPGSGLPRTFALLQNFPNPFNPSTVISYQLPKAKKVRITVLDILGREVQTLMMGEQSAGYHSVTFQANNLASGVYLYRFQAGEFTQTKRMILLK
jgi:hypothetical protein